MQTFKIIGDTLTILSPDGFPDYYSAENFRDKIVHVVISEGIHELTAPLFPFLYGENRSVRYGAWRG